MLPPDLEMTYTRTIVRKQNTKANRGWAMAAGMNDMENTIERAAPNDAPEDSPRMYGDARGLRNTACMTPPVIASPAPTNTPNTSLGALTFLTMMLFAQVPFPVITSQTSPMLSGTEA